MRLILQDRLLFFLLLTLSLIFSTNSASASCALVSPTSYKVPSGTNNFVFTLEMEARFVNDQFSHPCQYGVMIQDLLCVDYAQTECCCNSITKISKSVCKINVPITKNLQFTYMGLADVDNAAVGGICTGLISISIEQDKSSSIGIQVIIGIILGILIIAGVGLFVYKKVQKRKNINQQNPNMKDPFLQSQKQKKPEKINKNKNKVQIYEKSPRQEISERDKRILNQRLSKIQYIKKDQYKQQKQIQNEKFKQDQKPQKNKKYYEQGQQHVSKVQPKIQNKDQKFINYKYYQDEEDFKRWQYEQYLKEKERNSQKSDWNYDRKYQDLKTPINYKEKNRISQKYQQYETQGSQILRQKTLTQQQKKIFLMEQEKQFRLYQKKLQEQRLTKMNPKRSSGIYQYQNQNQEKQHITIDFPQNFHLNVTPSQLKKDQRQQLLNKQLSDVEAAKLYRQSLVRMKN